MNRRQFLSLTGTFTGGTLLVPHFLHAFGTHAFEITGNTCVVFIQLNGGNDGLNSYIPFDNPLYYDFRPHIAIPKTAIIGKHNGMGWHPELKGLAQIQQNGDLVVVQNVGYPNPNRSHFRSQEIWQTASSSETYWDHGWIGRYLDLHCKDHNPVAGVNFDTIDNLALKGNNSNAITLKDPKRFQLHAKDTVGEKLSHNPQLDFVRKIAFSITEGTAAIQKALQESSTEINYPKTKLGTNLSWIARLIKGNLNSKVYYTSQNGYDTHDNQLAIQQRNLGELNDAVFAFYSEMQQAQLLPYVTMVIFSEFGRRVQENGSGTDHGTAAPLFIIGGNNSGRVIGNNPVLDDLDSGDLKHSIDFRSVYASLLSEKLLMDATKIGILQPALEGIF